MAEPVLLRIARIVFAATLVLNTRIITTLSGSSNTGWKSNT